MKNISHPQKVCPTDGQFENQVAAADEAAWESLRLYFTIASTTARDKYAPGRHTGIVAGALNIAGHKLFE